MNTDWEPLWKEFRAQTHKNVSSKYIRAALHDIRKRDAAARGIRYYQDDPEMKKIQYIRYADDFIIGFIELHKEVKEIYSKITNKLNRIYFK